MARAGVLLHPVFVGAVLVLAFNDHIAKAAVPGLVTGKASDVAGVVVVALATYALIGRPRLAAVITATAFAALKLHPAVAQAAAPLLGGVTRTDPTDLIALAALVPLAIWLERSPPPPPARTWRLIPIGVLTVLVVTATSCETPELVDQIVVDGSQVWARTCSACAARPAAVRTR